MVTCILSTRLDGGVTNTVVSPALIMEFLRYGRATGTFQWQGNPVTSPSDVMSLADAKTAAAAFVVAKDIPSANTNIRVVEGEDLGGGTLRWPDGTTLERRFRGCCRRVGTALPQVDMPLARQQRMNEVRGERVPKLCKSDVDLLRAQEAANLVLQTSLKDYRQKLRDVPAVEQPNVDACLTPAQLSAWKPAWPVDPAP